MDAETLSVTITVAASADAVFAVLADPASHASIDGTGWVCEPVDGERLTRSGQVFRMGMYHPDHPDGRYETANQGCHRDCGGSEGDRRCGGSLGVNRSTASSKTHQRADGACQ